MSNDVPPPPPGSAGPGPNAPGGGSNGSASGGQPPWLIPALVGAIVVLLIVLLVVAVSGGDDETADPATTEVVTTDPPATDPPATDAPATDPPATEPPATDPPATEPPATEPPATDPPATDPPATDPPATDPPATDPPATDPVGPTALPAADLGAGQASIARADGSVLISSVNTCFGSGGVGLQITSAVAVSDANDVYVIDFVVDEGAEPTIVVTDLGGQIAGFFFGQDGPGLARWAGSPVDPFSATDRITLEPVDDEAALIGAINVSFQPAEADSSCATGFLSSEWTFAEGETPSILDPTEAFGRQFTVLAECAGGLILSEAGTLLSVDIGGVPSVTVEFPPTGDDPDFWFSPDVVGDDDVFVDQQGGGGDVTTVVRVEDITTGGSGNLTWTRPPTADGGLVDLDCRA